MTVSFQNCESQFGANRNHLDSVRPPEALVELHSSAFDERDYGDEGRITAEHDMNGDGQPDVLDCGFWSRWGRLTDCKVQLVGATDAISIDATCKRLGVLDFRENGLSGLVCDADEVLVFDAAAGGFKPRT